MGYIEKNLNNNEAILSKIKITRSILYIPAVIAILFLITGIVYISEGIEYLIVGLALAVIIMWRPVVIIYTTELGFTNKRLIGKTGLIKTQTLDSPLDKINNVNVKRGIIGRLLGYGSLKITTSSGEYDFSGVVRPEDFKNALMNQIDQFKTDAFKQQAQEFASALKS